MEQGVKERLNDAYKYLKFKGIIKKQEDVANKMGASRPNVSAALSGRPDVLTESFVARFCEAYNTISIGWVLNGDGPMLADDVPPVEVSGGAPPVLDDGNSFKYYYELAATAGNIEGITDNEIGQPYQRINFPGYEGCVAFNVSGESMLPTAKPKDIVLINPRPVDTIINGEIYFIVTRDDQRMIKRLVQLKPRHEEGPHLSCISDNPNQSLYGPIPLDGENVHKIYRVRGFISNTLLG